MKSRLTEEQRHAIQVVTTCPSYDVPHRVMLQIIRRGLVVLRNPGAGPKWAITDTGREALAP